MGSADVRMSAGGRCQKKRSREKKKGVSKERQESCARRKEGRDEKETRRERGLLKWQRAVVDEVRVRGEEVLQHENTSNKREIRGSTPRQGTGRRETWKRGRHKNCQREPSVPCSWPFPRSRMAQNPLTPASDWLARHEWPAQSGENDSQGLR